jgi:hypothetical protein
MKAQVDTYPANPTLLGLIGFLIPYTSTILILCGFQGAVAPASLVGLSGDYYFFGAIAMNIAGIAEFILGNSMLSLTYSLHRLLTPHHSVPNGGISHLRFPLGQSSIHTRSSSPNDICIRSAWGRERRSVQCVAGLS